MIHPNAPEVIAAILSDNPSAVRSALGSAHPYDEASQLAAVLNNRGMQTLHIAAANDCFAVAEWCCSIPGLDKSAPTTDTSWTPAHFAAYNSHDRICALLKHNEVETDRPDVYGETPCDVAIAIGHTPTIDVLGGNAAARAARHNYEEERRKLIAEARALEEERAALARRKELEDEERRVAETKKKERIRRAKELRATLERERLTLVERWLRSRESSEREILANSEWLFASHLLIGSDIMITELRAREIAESHSRMWSSDEARDAAGGDSKSQTRAKKKKKQPKPAAQRIDARGDRSKAAATERGPSPIVITSPEPQPSGSADAHRDDDDSDPALCLPVFSGIMTKEKRKELARAKARIARIKRERLAARERAAAEFRELCQRQCAEMDAEESAARKTVDIEWTTGLAITVQLDFSRDRRHVGEFVFHAAQPCCSCGNQYCSPNTFSWTCCGLRDLDSIGCSIVDDTNKPPIHPGSFQYHMEGCTCSQAVYKAKAHVAAARTLVKLRRRSSAVATYHYSQSRDAGDDDTMGEKMQDSADPSTIPSDEENAHSEEKALSSPLGEETYCVPKSRFCNPGGTVWSCCGSVEIDADGCTLQKRFLMVEHVLVVPIFVESTVWAAQRITSPGALRKARTRWLEDILGGSEGTTESVLSTYCQVDIEATTVAHRQGSPIPTAVTKCNVIGTLNRPSDVASLKFSGSIDDRRVSCFEVQVLECPSDSAEHMVIGWAEQDAYIGKGSTFCGDHGIGWWSNSTHIRGLGVSAEATDGYRESDVVCVAIDHVNEQLYCFRNRKLLARLPFSAKVTLVPALTLVAGCRVRSEETPSKASAAYVEDFIRREHIAGRQQRLFGVSSRRYVSAFRDRFEMSRYRAPQDEEDEFRINFDV